MRFVRVAAVLLCLSAMSALRAQGSEAARQVVEKMLANEKEAEHRHNKYMYMSFERSERTGGHLWQERVVETSLGKVRLLLTEDGMPLSETRAAAERARLADILARPEAFQRREQALQSDEQHAEDLLAIFHGGFLFDEPKVEGGNFLIDFKPNPTYKPQSLDERVLHAMSGTLVVDERDLRMRRIVAKTPTEVSLGFGLLATVRAGSGFDTSHELEPGNEWKDTTVETNIMGRAMFFKVIGKNEHSVHKEFQLVPNDITLEQAVEIVQR